MQAKRIAIFASGRGSNALRMIDYFKGTPISVALIVCNNPQAEVLKQAEKANVPALLINREEFYKSDLVLKRLQHEKIDLIVLAGFLWMIPGNILDTFKKRMINIHPALLPKFGGKGMYGAKVQQAVIDSKEKETGITIHYVNEHYDEGEIILQKKCEVTLNDTPETLAQKVHALEHEYYPKIVEQLINGTDN